MAFYRVCTSICLHLPAVVTTLVKRGEKEQQRELEGKGEKEKEVRRKRKKEEKCGQVEEVTQWMSACLADI